MASKLKTEPIHTWQISRIPTACSRTSAIFIIADAYFRTQECSLASLGLGVRLMDMFVEQSSTQKSEHGEEDPTERKEEIPTNTKYYSQELALTCFCIAQKYNADPCSLSQVCVDMDNIYPSKLEWEILASLNFNLRHLDFTSYLSICFGQDFRPGPKLWCLIKLILLNKVLINANPRTIIIAVLMLIKHRKLDLGRLATREQFMRLLLFNYELTVEQFNRLMEADS